jgi:voltage-gated potassium channel
MANKNPNEKLRLLNFDTQKDAEKPQNFSVLRQKIHTIIFEANTPLGKLFDVVLLVMIFTSVIVLMLDTVPHLNTKYHDVFVIFEWIVTLFFTIEYFLRIYSVYQPVKYMTSFFGIIDVLATCPMYINLFIPGVNSLMILRIFRLLRIFRIFKLESFLSQANFLIVALRDSVQKISIFLFFVLLSVTVFGSILYVIENDVNEGFNSIPNSIYWAIVTITTVGYGDISPITPLGKVIASFIMIVGYSIIAVPTGIVTSSIINTGKKKDPTRCCMNCATESHDSDAIYCHQCGYKLKEDND